MEDAFLNYTVTLLIPLLDSEGTKNSRQSPVVSNG